MASTNKAAKSFVDKEKNAVSLIRRSVMTCLLWEDTFYENGESVTDRVRENMKFLSKEEANKILLEAKFDNKLRHMPLFLLLCMAENKILDKEMVTKVITRVDDMTELVSIYFSEFRKSNDKDTKDRRAGSKLPKQVVKGLQEAFKKFDEYQFAKYQASKKEVKLMDVLKLVRPKPENDEQSKLWGKIIAKELATPDTWEVELSKTSDKKESWTRLLTSKTKEGYNKLGALALLRNISGMIKAGVDESIIREAIKSANTSKILPFQIYNAAKHAPSLSDILEDKFLESLSQYKQLDGDTIMLIDVSGSMWGNLSRNSDLTLIDVAATLAAMCKEICESSDLYSFNQEPKYISKHYTGFSLIDNLSSQVGGGTAVIASTKKAINNYKESHSGKYPKRVIVITDEQTNSDLVGLEYYSENSVKLDDLPDGSFGYIVNVASYEKEIDTETRKGWSTISGWSDNIIKYISEIEYLKEDN